MKQFLLAIYVLVALTGCAKHIKSDIAVFHELPDKLSGKRYSVLPFKEQEGNLEYKAYVRLLKQELQAKGLLEAPLDQSDIVVCMAYGIDTGREATYSIPFIGQTGVSSSSISETFQSYGNYGTYSGTTIYRPSYGIVGAAPMSYTKYTRYLILNFFDRKAFFEKQNINKLYEATVKSQGKSGQLSAIMPTMIKSLFEEFPGQNGSVRTSTRMPEQ